MSMLFTLMFSITVFGAEELPSQITSYTYQYKLVLSDGHTAMIGVNTPLVAELLDGKTILKYTGSTLWHANWNYPTGNWGSASWVWDTKVYTGEDIQSMQYSNVDIKYSNGTVFFSQPKPLLEMVQPQLTALGGSIVSPQLLVVCVTLLCLFLGVQLLPRLIHLFL